MTCPRMCRVLAKELLSNSGLSGCRVHAFDHCPCFSLKNFSLGIGGGVHIYLLSIQCHIEPRLLSLSLVAGSQCALPGCSLRKSSPTLSQEGRAGGGDGEKRRRCGGEGDDVVVVVVVVSHCVSRILAGSSEHSFEYQAANTEGCLR